MEESTRLAALVAAAREKNLLVEGTLVRDK
jgi:hypothetical protein